MINDENMNNSINKYTDNELDNAIGQKLYKHDYSNGMIRVPVRISDSETLFSYVDFFPTENLNQAWQCVEKMTEDAWFIDLFDDANSLCAKFTNMDTSDIICAYGRKPARIICEAILMILDNEK
jgi:hypothetical protein